MLLDSLELVEKLLAFAIAYLIPSPCALEFSTSLLWTILLNTMLQAVPMGVNTTVQHINAPVYPVVVGFRAT